MEPVERLDACTRPMWLVTEYVLTWLEGKSRWWRGSVLECLLAARSGAWCIAVVARARCDEAKSALGARWRALSEVSRVIRAGSSIWSSDVFAGGGR